MFVWPQMGNLPLEIATNQLISIDRLLKLDWWQHPVGALNSQRLEWKLVGDLHSFLFATSTLQYPRAALSAESADMTSSESPDLRLQKRSEQRP